MEKMTVTLYRDADSHVISILGKNPLNQEIIDMDQESSAGENNWETKEITEIPDLIRLYSRALQQPREAGSVCSDLGVEHSLDQIMELLVFAYITSNLKFKGIPLKTFITEFEKSVIHASLRLTNGNQKDTASLLSLKPTALFEKMRKHGLSGKQVKFTQQLYGASAERLANAAMS
jgi:hypothetical protein